ncbi:MAG: hypothetical protein JWS10_3502 [Cypionkella sp.]|nr:hypothetical protein [Cypionkella sp.]
MTKRAKVSFVLLLTAYVVTIFAFAKVNIQTREELQGVITVAE